MLDIFVCGVKEVDEFIDDVDGVISIMNPGYTIFTPHSITAKEKENRYSVLRLEFDDVWQETYQPGLEIVSEEILASASDFASDLVERFGDDINLLVHCHEGISRSSAIAIAIYVALYGEPKDAATRVASQRPQAVPNIEVIRLADSVLNLQGKLLDAVWEVFYPSSIDIANMD
jgi:predicted protein tyrosine phosphatase